MGSEKEDLSYKQLFDMLYVCITGCMCLPLELCLFLQQINIFTDIFSFSKTAPSSCDSQALEDQPSPKYSDVNQELYSFLYRQ